VAQAAVVLVLATRLALRHLKAVTVAQAQPAVTLALAVVAAHLRSEQAPAHQKQAATAVMAPHLVFPVAASLTQVVVVEEVTPTIPLAQAAQVVAAMAALHPTQPVQRAPLTPEAVAEAAETIRLAKPAAQAALASSSLSTTSALPQSSPSSHRRSGLHQRVR
jgi:hypothetical protein